MLISSGQQLRSFAAQNEFSFNINLECSNSSGVSKFGFSGDSGNLDFIYLESGNIFDFNRRHVWSYNPREVFNISGNISTHSINYFINNKPICLFADGYNNYYDNFYIQSNNVDINYNFIIEGQVPSYQFYFPDSALAGQSITGYLKNNGNNNESFKIFSGTVFNTNVDYELVSLNNKIISGNQSGMIELNPILIPPPIFSEPRLSRFDLFFNTNFGTVLNPVIFTLFPAPIYFIDIITGYTGVTGFLEDLTYGKIYNYEIRSIYPSDRSFTISLENFSGHTGEIIYREFELSGNVAGNISGFIYGFKNLTGILTGSGIDISEVDYFGNNPTGLLTYNTNILAYATGVIEHFYNLPLLGGSGTGLSPKGTTIIGSGYFPPISGIIFGSGILAKDVLIPITGNYFNSQNTGLIEGLLEFTGFYTGNLIIDYSKLLWKSDNITGNGYSGASDKLYNITGQEIYFLSPQDFGLITGGGVVSSPFLSGLMLTPQIKRNTGLFINSGSGFSSENQLLINNAFTGNNYFYITGETGFIGFFFDNYIDKNTITHYSFEVDFDSNRYPYQFSLELSRTGTIWTSIDDVTGKNFYEYSDYVNNCKDSFKTINNGDFYSYARLRIISGKNWDHDKIGGFSKTGIGIKNLELYSSLPVFVNNGEPSTEYKVIPTLTGYNQFNPSLFENHKTFSGSVFYSLDSETEKAWYAFNSNKNNYPYAEIISNNDGQFFLGYAVSGDIDVNLNRFYIEFEPGYEPLSLTVQCSDDGIIYQTIYETLTPTTVISSNITTQPSGKKYYRFLFNSGYSTEVFNILNQSQTWLDANDPNSIVFQ